MKENMLSLFLALILNAGFKQGNINTIGGEQCFKNSHQEMFSDLKESKQSQK